MIADLVLAAVTAVLASVCTLAAAWWLWERRLRRRLEARLEVIREELGETIRQRVRQGILDGIAAIPTGELLRNTQKGLADVAAELVRGGLSSLLGGGRPERRPSGGEDPGEP
jgi:hypothetical protein